jgi:LemA protein
VATGIFLAAAALLALAAGVSYNIFVRLRHKAGEAWSDITVMLKRRHDLIPNIVQAAKGYAAHEKAVFENVAVARTKAMSAGKIGEMGETENALGGAIRSVFALAEAYPELKASQNFLALQAELVETENRIQMARRYYNGNVRELNIAVESIPSNIIAALFHFTKMEYFKLDDPGEANVPAAKF